MRGGSSVYYGSASGLGIHACLDALTGELAGADFGFSASTAGDVNGDGYSDVIIGALQGTPMARPTRAALTCILARARFGKYANLDSRRATKLVPGSVPRWRRQVT